MKKVIFACIVFLFFPLKVQAQQTEVQGLEYTVWRIELGESSLVYVGFREGECYFGPTPDDLVPVYTPGYSDDGYYWSFFFISHFEIYMINSLYEELTMSGWLFPLRGRGFAVICLSNEGCIKTTMTRI